MVKLSKRQVEVLTKLIERPYSAHDMRASVKMLNSLYEKDLVLPISVGRILFSHSEWQITNAGRDVLIQQNDYAEEETPTGRTGANSSLSGWANIIVK